MKRLFFIAAYFYVFSVSHAGPDNPHSKVDIFEGTDFLVRQPGGGYVFIKDATFKGIFCTKNTFLIDNEGERSFMLSSRSAKNCYCRFKEFTINRHALFHYDGSPISLAFDEAETSLNPYGRSISTAVRFGQEKAVDKIVKPFNPKNVPYFTLSILRDYNEIGEEGLIIFFKKEISLKDIISLPKFSTVTFGVYLGQTYIVEIYPPKDSYIDLGGLPCEVIWFRQIKQNLNVPNLCRIHKTVTFKGITLVKGEDVFLKNSTYLKNKTIEVFSVIESKTGNTYLIESGKKVKTDKVREEPAPNQIL